MPDDTNLEAHIVRTYVLLKLTRPDAHGQQSVSLQCHGAYDVRLVEHPAKSKTEHVMFWIELFNHRIVRTLDTCAVAQMDDAVAVAREFISTAKSLDRGALREDD